MNRKKTAIILGTVIVIAAAVAGIWYYTKNFMHDSKDRVYVQKVSEIMQMDTGVENCYSGVVQPQKTVEINTDSERTVKEVYVKEGDTVEEGTPLFVYDTDDLSMEYDQAKLELDNQDLDIKGYQTQIAELEKEKKDAAASAQFEYTTQIQSIQTQIKQAEYEKSSKQLAMDKIKKKIDNSEVVSTAAGVIRSVNDSDSQDGSSGDGSSAFITILSTGTYRIKAMANEQNVNMISAGADVIVRSRVDEKMTWHGTIEKIDTGDASSNSSDSDGMAVSDDSTDSSSNGSSSYPFYIALDDAEGLMLGQHVLVELDEGQDEEKAGLWLFASYIVHEDAEEGDTEEESGGYADLSDTETADAESLADTEAVSDTEWPDEIYSYDFVWADDGNGRLMKKYVYLGEYDADLDEYQILGGLTEDDLIAWPMEGLYEGVKTVTNADDVDYSSSLYNQEDTEDLWDTEWDSEMWDTEMMDEDMIYQEYGTDGSYDDSADSSDSDTADADAEVSE